MQNLKNWILAALLAIAFLVVGALEDTPKQEQIAADELHTAAMQERQEEKMRRAYFQHLLSLNRIK